MPSLFHFALDGASNFFSSLTFKEVLGAFWAPLSIFAGAFAAFSFNNRRATRERIDKEVIEGNLALSVLIKFLNHQFLYKRNYIDPHRGAPDAWFKIMPGPPLDNGIRVELNKNNLGFLIQSSGAVWQRAIIEEERYHQVKGAIDNRNALLEKAWQKLEEAGFEHESKIPASEIEKALGPVLFQQLKQISNALIEQVTLNVASTAEAMKALRDDLVRMYPKRGFINAVLPPTAPLTDPPVAASKPVSKPMISVYEFDVPRDKLLAMPVEERGFLLSLGYALNHVQMLQKLTIFSLNNSSSIEAEETLCAAQTQMLVRLLIGALHETWKIIESRFVGTSLGADYASRLDAGGHNALRTLTAMFEESTLLTMIRSNFSFHFPNDKVLDAAVRDATNRAGDDDLWRIYFSQYGFNSLFLVADLMAIHGIMRLLKETDHVHTQERMMEEVRTAADNLFTFTNAFFAAAWLKNFGPTLDARRLIEIPMPQPMETIRLPFFVNMDRA